MNAGLVSGAGGRHVFDQYSGIGLKPECYGEWWSYRSGKNSDLSAMDMPIFPERSVHIPDHITRNREPDSFTAARLSENESINPHHPPLNIHQGTATVAGIDGSVGLYENPGVVLVQLARRRTDDTHADGIVHSERAAESQHELSLFYLLRVVDRQRLEVSSLDFQ